MTKTKFLNQRNLLNCWSQDSNHLHCLLAVQLTIINLSIISIIILRQIHWAMIRIVPQKSRFKKQLVLRWIPMPGSQRTALSNLFEYLHVLTNHLGRLDRLTAILVLNLQVSLWRVGHLRHDLAINRVSLAIKLGNWLVKVNDSGFLRRGTNRS